ncbi:MAG: M20/M25/M40 family metallo-hydrolase [Ignavibacteriales bacterium]|nr:M20/M25/M40 family metallo-hydrolase [Ignavibacteriales bacterium]
MHRSRLMIITFFVVFMTSLLAAQSSVVQRHEADAQRIIKEALGSNMSMENLTDLCTKVGHRISGSPQAAKAVEWAKQKMEEYGFDNVHLEPVMVPRWVRGPVEEGYLLLPSGKKEKLKITMLGGSVGTPAEGITADVIEVKSFEELRNLGDKAKGKIVFFNRPMDRTLLSTFAAYGGAVDQRGGGANMAAKAGGVAALVRSMTTRVDDFPHTGGMGYADSVKKVPGVAISTRGAEELSKLLAQGTKVRIQLKLSATMLPDVESANVVGELRGTEKPDEVIVMGGHLDSWDIGQGAHDDGAGCVQSIEALRILKKLGLKPKRTIRAVMFMNEENGLRGGIGYAAKDRPGEKHIAALESDEGGFMPRGFGIADTAAYKRMSPWAPLLASFGADRIQLGGGAADISPLAQKGVPLIALSVDTQRYFDSHHSENDNLGAVNERELALGAAAMAILTFVLAQEGM